jgi:hypothetical protein
MSFFARAQNVLRCLQHYDRPFPAGENALDQLQLAAAG